MANFRFDGIQTRKSDIRYYYPTDDLITAPGILFFWVARMIMAVMSSDMKSPSKMFTWQGCP
jgi:valyl-tRNA synthetase